MAASLRELVLNEARAYAVFANGRLSDHRFAVSLVCDELPDMRFNRTYVLEPGNLTSESLEEISRDYFSLRVPLRLDIFLPIPEDIESLLERRGFELTEDYASEMILGESTTALRKNPGVIVKKMAEPEVDAFNRIMVKAFEAPPDMVATLRSIFGRTVRGALKHSGAVFYLAFLGDEPVGALYLFSHGGVCGGYNLAVAQSARRQGIATTLILQAIEDHMAGGTGTLCMQTRVGSFQERFYERMGFQAIARRKRAVRMHT